MDHHIRVIVMKLARIKREIQLSGKYRSLHTKQAMVDMLNEILSLCNRDLSPEEIKFHEMRYKVKEDFMAVQDLVDKNKKVKPRVD